MRKEEQTNTSIAMSKQLLHNAKVYAAKEGVSLSELIRRLLSFEMGVIEGGGISDYQISGTIAFRGENVYDIISMLDAVELPEAPGKHQSSTEHQSAELTISTRVKQCQD